DGAVPLAGLRRGIVQVDDLEAVPRDQPVDLGDREIDPVLHSRAFGQHRALHRPRCVDAELALGTLLSIDAAHQTHDAEEQCDGRGHAQDSHGWTSLIGAIMRHSDPAGRYQTMLARRLSTSARLLAPGATAEPGAALE